MNPHIRRVLGGLHDRVALRMMGRQPRQWRYGVWTYPPLEDVMAEMGIQEVETYVSRNQKIVTQFIVTRPIMDLCLVEEQRPGPRISMQWWEQDGVDVEEM